MHFSKQVSDALQLQMSVCYSLPGALQLTQIPAPRHVQSEYTFSFPVLPINHQYSVLLFAFGQGTHPLASSLLNTLSTEVHYTTSEQQLVLH